MTTSVATKRPTKKLMLQILKDTGRARKFYKGPYLEDRDQIIADIKRQLIEQGADEKDIVVDAQTIAIGGQFWWLPRHPRDGHLVTVEVRTADIITTPDDGEPCFGAIKDWQVSEDGTHLVHEIGTRLYPMD